MILLPVPHTLQALNGKMRLSPEAVIVLPPDASAVLHACAEQLKDDLRIYAGSLPRILCGEARTGDIALCRDEALPEQAYTLLITAEGIRIAGSGDAGILYGVQTLRQIIRQEGALLSACRIEDAPCYPVRGYYFDVSRGRTPTLESLLRLADTACYFKLNQLQLYVEHTYLFRDLSEVWRAGEPLSAEDIMTLDRYCRDRGIELVPSLASFGHLFELLHSRSFSELCELENARDIPSTMPNRMRHHTLNVSDDRSFALIARMIDEFMPLFSSRKFNLCADETFDLGKGRNRERMRETGERAFYIGFVKKLCDHIIARGRQPMFWGDIIARFPEALKDLPKDVICLNWNYRPNAADDTAAIAATGARQYVCPGVIGWNQWINRYRDSYDNISRMADYGRRYGAEGLLNTDWGDYGHINDPVFSVPGLIYGAVMSWQRENPSMEELNRGISRLYYTDPSGSVMDQLTALQDCAVYSWRCLVQHRDYMEGTYETDPAAPNADLDAIRAADARMDAIADALRAASRGMDTSMRPLLSRWLTAIDGIRLCNHAGWLTAHGLTDPALAEALENWFRRYAALWRDGSRESELRRSREVIYWYADQLRP